MFDGIRIRNSTPQNHHIINQKIKILFNFNQISFSVCKKWVHGLILNFIDKKIHFLKVIQFKFQIHSCGSFFVIFFVICNLGISNHLFIGFAYKTRFFFVFISSLCVAVSVHCKNNQNPVNKPKLL